MNKDGQPTHFLIDLDLEKVQTSSNMWAPLQTSTKCFLKTVGTLDE